jgi:hypothetical protein
VVGTDAEKERRTHAVAAQQVEQPGDTFTGAAQRVDVNFKSEHHEIDFIHNAFEA